MSLPCPAVRPNTIVILLPLAIAATALAGGPQFVDQTGSRFPTQSEYSNQVTAGDLDGDGDIDLIFANGGGFSSQTAATKARVYINDGAGFFTDETDARTGGFAGWFRGVELGDIDNDGDLDVVLAQDFLHRPELLINDGNGFFALEGLARGLTMNLSSSRAQFGDTDNDGDLDLFITTGTSNRFTCGQYRLYENDGNGYFTDITSSNFPTGLVCNNMDCIFGDIDNDFDIDIRTASTGTANSRLYVNDGKGTFALSTSIPADSTCYSYDFGDINGDGDLDLIGVNAGSGSTELLLSNNGSGVFSNVSSQIIPNPNQDDNDSKFFDYDNDGDLDLIIARLGSGGEKIYNNNGSGTFTQVSGIITVISDSSLDVIVADLTGDGALDVVTAQGESGSFQNRIYISNGPADTLPPTIIDTEQVVPSKNPGAQGGFVVRSLILDGMTSDRNFIDNGIFLNYSVDGGEVSQVPMRHSGGQVYRGVIPCDVNGLVEYFVTALDDNDNLGTGATLSFEIDQVVGDVSGDGLVNVTDLIELIASWGPCSSEPKVPCPADTDCSGDVDVTDLVNVISNWS